MKTNTPAGLRLGDGDIFFLSLTLSHLRVFPDSLIEGGSFQPSLLEDALNAHMMSPTQVAAAAYFGFLPIARSYKSFCVQADLRNRQRCDDKQEADKLRKDVRERENEAASECGMSRGEMKRLYEDLDRIAFKHGFGSFEAIWDCRGHIENDIDRAGPADRRPYIYGPRALWDIAKRARVAQMRDITFDTAGQWILFLHREKTIVHAHAIQPSRLKFGGFEAPKAMPEADGNEFDSLPDPILMALFDLAAHRYPECEFDLVPAPIVLSIKLGEEV